MKQEILLLREVAERLRVSTATVNRLLAQRRKGIGTFCLPISTFKGKGRWLASDVENYIASLSNSNVTVPIKNEKQKTREFNERQQRAKAALARHTTKKGT